MKPMNHQQEYSACVREACVTLPSRKRWIKKNGRGKGIKCLVFQRSFPLADVNILLQSKHTGWNAGWQLIEAGRISADAWLLFRPCRRVSYTHTHTPLLWQGEGSIALMCTTSALLRGKPMSLMESPNMHTFKYGRKGWLWWLCFAVNGVRSPILFGVFCHGRLDNHGEVSNPFNPRYSTAPASASLASARKHVRMCACGYVREHVQSVSHLSRFDVNKRRCSWSCSRVNASECCRDTRHQVTARGVV